MLHLFRKIRRDLIDNSKFYKYFKYAIGEIVLVVLGILIALYINNWNEQKKKQEKFNMLMIDVEKELINNISRARDLTGLFAFHDSLCLKFFIDSMRIDDRDLYEPLLLGAVKLNIRDDSFQKLNQLNNLSKEQEPIMDALIYLDSEGTTYLDDLLKRMMELAESRGEAFTKYDWYESWRFFQDDDRIFDFFNNDPKGRNLVLENFVGARDYRVSVAHYYKQAVPVYEKIYMYLDSLKIRESDSLLFQYDHNDYKHYLGKYDATWCTEKDFVFDDSVVVSTEKGKLFWIAYRTDETGSKKEITPINKYHFIDENYGFYHLEFDVHGDVKGIRFSHGPRWIYSLKKVR